MVEGAQGRHYKIEMGFCVSPRKWRQLKRGADRLNLKFSRKLKIIDLVVPRTGRSTRRLRVQRTVASSDGFTGVKLLRCSKSHPIRGEIGEHIRFENDPEIKLGEARKFLDRAVERQGAAIPRYRKTRTEYTYEYGGFDLTVSFDHASGLGRHSGHYVEFEIMLPEGSTEVVQALATIKNLAALLLGAKCQIKISYRKMLMDTWTHGKIERSKRKVERLCKQHRRFLEDALREAS